MEFKTELQRLRLNKEFTQEQLAEKLFVSRVTVSKWESGRGYPNIESLKLIVKVFSIPIDDLLSSDELITIAENQTQENSRNLRTLVFGIIDIMPALLFVLPFFGNEIGYQRIEHVALPAFDAPYYIRLVFYIQIISSVIFGITELAMQNIRSPIWLRLKFHVSSFLSVILVLFSIMIRQPYDTTFLFCLLLFKVILLLKKE